QVMSAQDNEGGVPYSLKATFNGYFDMSTYNSVASTGWLIFAIQGVNPLNPQSLANVAQFSQSNYSLQEDCTSVNVTVNRTGDTSGTASVDYSTSDGTATERKDYIKALGTLRFAAGETSKTIAVLINEDSFTEGNETFSISLSNPSGVSLGTSVA